MQKTVTPILFLLMLFAAGCSIAPVKEVHYFPGGACNFTADDRQNLFAEQKYFDKNEKQKLALSFSGGGVRSQVSA